VCPFLRHVPTHVVLLFHIDPPLVFANTQSFVLGQLLDFPIMTLISQRSCGRQEEAAQYHRGDEGKAEEREWVLGQRGAVAGWDAVVVGGRAELLRLKDGHIGDDKHAPV